jgi:hypothetical protein
MNETNEPKNNGCSPAALPEMPVQETTPPPQCEAELSGAMQTIKTERACQSTGCFPTAQNKPQS